MSNQIEQTRAGLARLESENNCGTSDFIEAKRIAFAQVRKVLDALPAETIPSDIQEAAKAYEDGLDYHECFSQWPSVGFAAGMLAERERLMKEAVECEIGWSDGYRIAPANESSMNEALAKIGVLNQVGAGVDAKVSVIIIKKEK